MVAPRRDSASPPLAAPRGFPKGVSRRDPRPWRRQRGRDWGPEMGGPGRGHTDGAGRSGPIPGLTFGDGKIARRGGEAVTVEVQGVESDRSLRGRLPRAPRGRDLPASGSAGFSPGDGAEARQCLGHVTTCPCLCRSPVTRAGWWEPGGGVDSIPRCTTSTGEGLEGAWPGSPPLQSPASPEEPHLRTGRLHPPPSPRCPRLVPVPLSAPGGFRNTLPSLCTLRLPVAEGNTPTALAGALGVGQPQVWPARVLRPASQFAWSSHAMGF